MHVLNKQVVLIGAGAEAVNSTTSSSLGGFAAPPPQSMDSGSILATLNFMIYTNTTTVSQAAAQVGVFDTTSC